MSTAIHYRISSRRTQGGLRVDTLACNGSNNYDPIGRARSEFAKMVAKNEAPDAQRYLRKFGSLPHSILCKICVKVFKKEQREFLRISRAQFRKASKLASKDGAK
jgi:hypothetical protein